MEYEIGISSPDELNTPVMICGTDGIVIYKNNAAVREVRLPKRRTHIQPHLHPSDAARFSGIFGGKKSVVITVDTGDGKMRAFASPYERQGKPCVLLTFPAVIQVYSKTKYTRAIEDAVFNCADEICDIVKYIDEKSFYIGEKKKASINKRIQKKLDDVISRAFFSESNTMYRLNSSIKTTSTAIKHTFGSFGFDIRIDYSELLRESGLQLYIDLAPFIVFFYYLTAFFIECGSDRTMNVEFSLSKQELFVKYNRKLRMHLLLSMPYPPFYTLKETDLVKLSELSPSNIIDILLFDRLAKAYGFNFSFSISDDHMNNVAVFAEIPIVEKSIFSEPEYTLGDDGYSMEDRLLESDLMFMFTTMCLHRGYKYRKKKSD